MPGAPLPPNHRFGRYCKPSQVFKETGEIASSAFRLRPGETYVSGGCLEMYSPVPGEQEEGLRICYSRVLTYSRGALFAILRISRTVAEVRTETGRTLRFLHEPEPEHQAHSGIYDTTPDEDRIAELIARSIESTIPAVV
jgi:hypothetical protein